MKLDTNLILEAFVLDLPNTGYFKLAILDAIRTIGIARVIERGAKNVNGGSNELILFDGPMEEVDHHSAHCDVTQTDEVKQLVMAQRGKLCNEIRISIIFKSNRNYLLKPCAKLARIAQSIASTMWLGTSSMAMSLP